MLEVEHRSQRLLIELPRETWEAVKVLAVREHRSPRDQIEWLVIHASQLVEYLEEHDTSR